MGTLDEQVALITGGGSGLGRALVRRFIDEGAHVGVLDLSATKSDELVDEFGEGIVVTVGDVASADDNELAVARTVERFGRLDTFVGNAGVWDFNLPLDAVDGATLGVAFDQVFAVNVKGLLLGARAAVGALRQTRGSMIFTLSNAASIPGGGGALYTSSKHAGVGLVRQLAWELQDEVRVNAVAPGLMSTDLRGVAALEQERTSLATMIESAGGEQAIADMLHRSFFPSADDYLAGYVMLASPAARTTTGAILEMHGVLGPPERRSER